MDDIVRQAIAKWPHVPHCHGWLGLDSRGQWRLRDEEAQAAGAFTGADARGRGSVLRHEKLIAFIGRNYDADADGQWFFQNGPQRVYVELEAAPFVWRLTPQDAQPLVQAHTGLATTVRGSVVDEKGHLYLDTPLGLGLVHSQDMLVAAQAVDQGLWAPLEMTAAELPARFGFVRSPQARQRSAP